MEKYNKSELQKMASKLFQLCLTKQLDFSFHSQPDTFEVYISGTWYWASIEENDFNTEQDTTIPIWKLIEMVENIGYTELLGEANQLFSEWLLDSHPKEFFILLKDSSYFKNSKLQSFVKEFLDSLPKSQLESLLVGKCINI